MLIIIAVFLLPLSVGNLSLSRKFKHEYILSTEHKTFYRLYDTAMTWVQARQICEADGSGLTVPKTLNEMETLKLLFSNVKAHFTSIFVGIHDLFSKGHFVTVKGEPIADSILNLFWGDGRPDDETGNEHCVVMTRQGMFDDRSCDKIYPFICSISYIHTTPNEECNNYDVGYKKVNDKKCYKFHEEPLTWHDAFMVCALEQGNLAIVNSPEEANLVTAFLGEHLKSNAPDASILLLGFSDLLFPYQYRTIRGQSLQEAGYGSWGPNTDDVETMKQKRCGAISSSGFLLVTYCDKPAMFLCEVNLKSNATTITTKTKLKATTTVIAKDLTKGSSKDTITASYKATTKGTIKATTKKVKRKRYEKRLNLNDKHFDQE